LANFEKTRDQVIITRVSLWDQWTK